MEVLRVENIKKSFSIGKNNLEVLKGVSFSLNKGEIINVMEVVVLERLRY